MQVGLQEPGERWPWLWLWRGSGTICVLLRSQTSTNHNHWRLKSLKFTAACADRHSSNSNSKRLARRQGECKFVACMERHAQKRRREGSSQSKLKAFPSTKRRFSVSVAESHGGAPSFRLVSHTPESRKGTANLRSTVRDAPVRSISRQHFFRF